MTRHASDRHEDHADQLTRADLLRRDLARPDLPAIENEVRARWAEAAVPGRSLARAAGTPVWTCWSEPQAAAGLPGVHDVPAEALRDTYQRLKTMQGFAATGGSGVSCHGLAVEVGVERELGLPSRADIEAYGVGRFNARCRESAVRHAQAFSDLTTQLGCRQAEAPDATMDAGYVESVWRSLCQLFEAGLLERDNRITPYCPRCQTPLSAQDINHPGARRPAVNTGVVVRLRLATLPDGAIHCVVPTCSPGPRRPWTLVKQRRHRRAPAPDVVLARRAGHDDGVIVAEARPDVGRTGMSRLRLAALSWLARLTIRCST
jgi:isoleucyl-tRNA synthetase